MIDRMLFTKEALPHLPALRVFAASLCHDPQRADDLVQETMLKAFRAFETYHEGTNCRAWLFQICKFSHINDYRRKQREPIAVDFNDEAANDTLRSDSEMRTIHVRNMTEGEDTRFASFGDEVTAALESIPAEYSTALMLSDVEGYSYEEVAQFTSAPIGTVRSRIHRGRKLLARQLGEYAVREGLIYGVQEPREKSYTPAEAA